MASPNARRLRRLGPEVSAVTAGVSVAGASTPAATSSFLSVVAAFVALFSGVATSKLGVAAVDVAGAVEAADAAVLVLLASLVEAGAVDVDASGASDAVATAATLSLVVFVFSSAAAVAAVPTITSVPNSTEQTPTFNLRIENLLIRSLNKSFPI